MKFTLYKGFHLTQPLGLGTHNNPGYPKGDVISNIKKEVEEIPGEKEAKEIKETVNKVKNFTKILK